MRRAIVFALCGLAAFAQAQAPVASATPASVAPVAPIRRVDVFVSDLTPMAAGVESVALDDAGTLDLWNLDDMERFNQKMAVGLPRDAQAAARIVAQRATSLSHEDANLLSKAAQGQARADGLSIDRVPAVVINEKHVYYGARSIEEALNAYRSGR